jgi:hypothetical protein
MLRFLKQIALFFIIVSCCTCSMQGDKSKLNAKPAEQQKGILVYSEQIKLITSIIGTLSVIIAVLTFATNVRSKETENKRNQAKLIKEHLGELSSNIYLLEWTTITKSHISIIVSKVMDKVRALLKDPNDKNEIEQILSNSLRIQFLIESAWHESSEIKKIELYMTNFSKSEIFLNYYFPFLYKLLNDYGGQLRIIYLCDVTAGINFRDTSKIISEFNKLLKANPAPLDALEMILYRHLHYEKRDSISLNREIFDEFYKFCNVLDHNSILKLSEFARKSNRKGISSIQKITSIRTYISEKIKSAYSDEMLRLLEKYIELQRNSNEARFAKFLDEAKKLSPTDPDIDVFLAVLGTGDNDEHLKLLKTAESKGANLQITEQELKERYPDLWHSNSLD